MGITDPAKETAIWVQRIDKENKINAKVRSNFCLNHELSPYTDKVNLVDPSYEMNTVVSLDELLAPRLMAGHKNRPPLLPETISGEIGQCIDRKRRPESAAKSRSQRRERKRRERKKQQLAQERKRAGGEQEDITDDDSIVALEEAANGGKREKKTRPSRQLEKPADNSLLQPLMTRSKSSTLSHGASSGNGTRTISKNTLENTQSSLLTRLSKSSSLPAESRKDSSGNRTTSKNTLGNTQDTLLTHQTSKGSTVSSLPVLDAKQLSKLTPSQQFSGQEKRVLRSLAKLEKRSGHYTTAALRTSDVTAYVDHFVTAFGHVPFTNLR